MYKKYMRSSFKGKKVAMIEDMQIKFDWIQEISDFWMLMISISSVILLWCHLTKNKSL